MEHAAEWNGAFYFAANRDTGSRSTIIATDGTRAGTLVAFTNSLAGNSTGRMYGLTAWNGSLYFLGEVSVPNRYALFRWSPGEPAPTALTPTTFSQLLTGAASLTHLSQYRWFVPAGDYLYFRAGSTGITLQEALWRTDGTASGTLRVNAAGGASLSAPSFAVEFAGKLLFYGSTPASGYEPMISDGTTAGTSVLADLNPGFSGSLTMNASNVQASFTAVNGKAFFTAANSANGFRFALFQTSGTAASTSVVPTLANALIPHSFTQSASLGDRLYFAATQFGVSGVKLYSTDGTAAGLREESASFYNITGLRVVDDWLYFTAETTAQATELYRLSSEANSAVLVHDLVPGISDQVGRSASWTRIARLGDSLYFAAASPGLTGGFDLWRSDIATREGRSVAQIIPLGDTDVQSYFIHPALGQVFFEVDGPNYGIEAWRYVPGVGLIDRKFELTPAGPRVVFEFDMPVSLASVNVGDLSSFNLTTNSPGPAATSVDVSTDGLIATFTLPASLGDGRYRFTIGTGKVLAATGDDVNEADFVHTGGDAFMLGGDANRDGVVNFDDLLLLAASYGQTGKAWQQGDFTFDGVVNFDDLLVLAARYNNSLSAAAAVLLGGSNSSTGPAGTAPPPVRPGLAAGSADDGDAGSAGVLA